MDFSATHVGYVLVAYGLSGLLLIALSGGVIYRDRMLAKKLRESKNNET
jgi:hypothetical protein